MDLKPEASCGHLGKQWMYKVKRTLQMKTIYLIMAGNERDGDVVSFVQSGKDKITIIRKIK